MGYRKLLKDYMSHIEAVTGSDFVELASLTNALDKRELGELRTIAAELKRERFNPEASANRDHVVRELLEQGHISLQQLANVQRFDRELADELSSVNEVLARLRAAIDSRRTES